MPKKELKLGKKEILNLYHNRRYTTKEVAEQAGTSSGSLYRLLHKYEKEGEAVKWRDTNRLIKKVLDSELTLEGKLKMQSDSSLTLPKYFSSSASDDYVLTTNNRLNCFFDSNIRIIISHNRIAGLEDKFITADIVSPIYNSASETPRNSSNVGNPLPEDNGVYSKGMRTDLGKLDLSKRPIDGTFNDVWQKFEYTLELFEAFYHDEEGGLIGHLKKLGKNLKKRELAGPSKQIISVLEKHHPEIAKCIIGSNSHQSGDYKSLYDLCMVGISSAKAQKIIKFTERGLRAKDMEKEEEKINRLREAGAEIMNDTMRDELGKVYNQWSEIALKREKRRRRVHNGIFATCALVTALSFASIFNSLFFKNYSPNNREPEVSNRPARTSTLDSVKDLERQLKKPKTRTEAEKMPESQKSKGSLEQEEEPRLIVPYEYKEGTGNIIFEEPGEKEGIGYLHIPEVKSNGITKERVEEVGESASGLLENIFGLGQQAVNLPIGTIKLAAGNIIKTTKLGEDNKPGELTQDLNKAGKHLGNIFIHAGTEINHITGIAITDAPVYLIQGKPGMITSAEASNKIQDFIQ